MIIKEYGSLNNDVIILLHGGGLSVWNYKEEIGLLKDNYHIVLPILDGHFGSDSDFISIEENANKIIDLIDERFNKRVKMIGGLSLGGQILLEIMSKREDICECAVIESALAYKLPFINKMVKTMINMSYGLINKRWFSKLQFKSLKIKSDLFENYYYDSSHITKENLTSFMKANTSYDIKDTLSDSNAKTLIFVGGKESPVMKKSAKLIKSKINNSKLEILDGYYHGDISINHPVEYVEKVNKYFNLF